MTKTPPKPENYISVDIEGTEHTPRTEVEEWGTAIREIGACEVGNLQNRFFVKFFDRGYPIKQLISQKEGMEQFEAWLKQFEHPIFVSFNSWDWVHVMYYFWKFLGRCPFGLPGRSIDIKVYFMGREGKPYQKTHKHAVTKRYPTNFPHTHNGLDDAIEQADIFAKMLWSSE
jgi:hypothetical protein